MTASGLTAVADSAVPLMGDADEPVPELNRQALARLRTGARLEVVPGATHLFEEPGALEQVSRLATDWFARHLAA